MGPLIRSIIVLLAFMISGSYSFAEDYLYLPQQVKKGESDQLGKDGVLVREVTVKKRDTLSGISKRYSGKGIYYPQILLFNNIKNPHWIHPGDVLRVPVTSKSSVTARQVSVGETEQTAQAVNGNETRRRPAAKKGKSRSSKHKDLAPQVANLHSAPSPLARESADTLKAQEIGLDEQTRYARALATARKGDCPESVKMFDEFIRLYPKSVLMSEATLNRAECYLKMSGQ